MKKIVGLFVLTLWMTLLMSGCTTAQYSASTEASFSKDGTWSYKSSKNQENFKAKIAEAADGSKSVEVETTATTPESAVAAALQTNLEALKSLSAAMSLIPKK